MSIRSLSRQFHTLAATFKPYSLCEWLYRNSPQPSWYVDVESRWPFTWVPFPPTWLYYHRGAGHSQLPTPRQQAREARSSSQYCDGTRASTCTMRIYMVPSGMIMHHWRAANMWPSHSTFKGIGSDYKRHPVTNE